MHHPVDHSIFTISSYFFPSLLKLTSVEVFMQTASEDSFLSKTVSRTDGAVLVSCQLSVHSAECPVWYCPSLSWWAFSFLYFFLNFTSKTSKKKKQHQTKWLTNVKILLIKAKTKHLMLFYSSDSIVRHSHMYTCVSALCFLWLLGP